MLNVIERAMRGEATYAEREQLREWRRTSPEHEQEYRAAKRLLEIVRSCYASRLKAPPRPKAAAIIVLSKRGDASESDPFSA